MVLGQKKYIVKSLQTIALKVVAARLLDWERLPIEYSSEEWMQIITDFRVFADPIIPYLVECGHLQNSEKFGVLFLSDSIKKRTVRLFGRYTTQIVDLIEEFELCDSEALRRVTELSIEADFPYMRGRLFSKFPNLKTFRIKRELTDETLRSLARHFPKLRVFDGSCPGRHRISDHGLARLARLRRLRYVLLGKQDRGSLTTVTGRGMASLLMQLPELVKFTCPEAIMSDTLAFLQLSNSLLLTVKSMDLGFMYWFKILASNVLITVSKVCPNVERLDLFVCEDEVELVNEQLCNFTGIKELRGTTFKGFDRNFFKSVGRQLVVLHLENLSLKLADWIIMSEECPNVKLLHLGGDYLHDPPSLQDCLSPTWPLVFPSVQILDFHWVDLDTLYLFMHKSSNLVRVSITGFAEDGAVLKSLVHDHGFWRRVEMISITILDDNLKEVYDGAVAQHLVEALPSLKQISVSTADEEAGVFLTSSRGNDVLLCSSYSFNLYSKDPELDYLDCFGVDISN